MKEQKKKIDLLELNDIQRMLLSQFSYLNFTPELRTALESGEVVKLKDLQQYLSYPHENILGSPTRNLGNEKVVNKMVGTIVGMEDLPTQNEFFQKLINNGLEDLIIKDFTDNESGFEAIAFEDQNGKIGISCRGSDIESMSDWNMNAIEYYNDDSQQLNDAREFYKKNVENQEHCLYGHSKGGNIISHLYLENHDNDKLRNVCSINGMPVSEELIDTDKKVEAFNDKERFNFYIIAGDPVSQLRSYKKYNDNVTYVRNKNGKGNFIRNHLVESASYDENGNFITIPKEKAYSNLHDLIYSALSITEKFKPLKNSFAKIINLANRLKGNIANAYRETKAKMSKVFSKKSKLLTDGSKSLKTPATQEISSNNDLDARLDPRNYIGTNGYTEKDAEAALNPHIITISKSPETPIQGDPERDDPLI